MPPSQSKLGYSRLVAAEYVRDYVIRVRFKDGVEGLIDLKDELWGQVFEPLNEIGRFKAFRVDPEIHTIVWDTGADLAPEFLYEEALASNKARENG